MIKKIVPTQPNPLKPIQGIRLGWVGLSRFSQIGGLNAYPYLSQIPLSSSQAFQKPISATPNPIKTPWQLPLVFKPQLEKPIFSFHASMKEQTSHHHKRTHWASKPPKQKSLSKNPKSIATNCFNWLDGTNSFVLLVPSI